MRHRSRQPDVTLEGADLDHELVALLEQVDVPFVDERQMDLYEISAALLHEAERRAQGRSGRRILAVRVQQRRELAQACVSEHFARKQRDLDQWDWREIFLGFS